MPDWKSPAELQVEGGIFARFMHALLGLYAYVVLITCSWFRVSITANHRYEFFLTLDFDWEFISGKKRFRWPLVKYSVLTTFYLPLIIQCRYSISPIDIFCCQLLLECKSCDLLLSRRGALIELIHSAIALDTNQYD